MSDRAIEDTPQILGIDCKKVVQYEKLPIGSKRLKQLLTLTQSLKRNDLIPDSITYGVENEPVLTYGTVKVSMGFPGISDPESGAAGKNQAAAAGNGRNTTFRKLDRRNDKYCV